MYPLQLSTRRAFYFRQ